jgi:ribose transport system ATP-binding protein
MFEQPAAASTGVAVLEIRGLSKRFGATQALRDVDLDVARGEIHALCGGNGSGKSTLIKILTGVYRGDPGGTVRVGSESIAADDVTPEFAERAGIRVVHQDLGVFPSLSVMENIALGGHFPTDATGRLRWRQLRAEARELIEQFHIPARPETPLHILSRAAQTQVAIARALRDRRDEHGSILVLDEPTSALPVQEVEQLLAALRRYASGGQSILYVSNRLDEVVDLCGAATVLRDGVKQGTWPMSELSEAELIRRVVGRSIDHQARSIRATGAKRVLEVRALTAGPVRGADLHVEGGEVVGVAGLLGAGRSELLRAIFGDLPIEDGEVLLDGAAVRFKHPADAMGAGVALVPEDRGADAAFLDLAIFRNTASSVLSKYWKGLRLRAGRMRRDGAKLIEDFGVKAAGPDALLSTLSGGNQQKVILARWLQRSPRLLLLDEPSQGVDVGARADIYKIVQAAVDAGAGALIVASDFEELARVADRAVVLRAGRVVAEVTGPDLNAHRLTELSYAERVR